MQAQKCSLLLCQGQERPNEENMQQQTSSAYTMQMKSSQLQSNNIKYKPTHEKTIFSFRHSCFRNFEDSDKNRKKNNKIQAHRQHPGIKIQQCRSPQRPPFRIIQDQMKNNHQVRHFVSPPQRKMIIYAPTCTETVSKNSSSIRILSSQQQRKPSIKFETKQNMVFCQVIDVNSKNSAQTQLSSINSQYNIRRNEIDVPNKQIQGNQSQILRQQPLLSQQKYQLKKSLSIPGSKITLGEQIVYPSFDNLQNIQPRKFFENAKTIKTIFTTSELKDQSILKSFNELAFQEKSQTQQIEYLDDQDMKKRNKFVRDKKKTAYFGCIEKQNETERSIIHGLCQQPSPSEHLQAQQQKHSAHRKKVQFLFQSQIDDSTIKPNQKNYLKKSNIEPKYSNQANMYQPSLHIIIDPLQAQQKLSIENSVKEMQFVNTDAFEGKQGRFKYVNTIKSIGGESLKSENSYLDIKFMQNVNSRRCIVKLV